MQNNLEIQTTINSISEIVIKIEQITYGHHVPFHCHQFFNESKGDELTLDYKMNI